MTINNQNNVECARDNARDAMNHYVREAWLDGYIAAAISYELRHLRDAENTEFAE